MRLTGFARRWDQYFFAPESGEAIAAIRILVAFSLIIFVLSSLGTYGFWAGRDGILSADTIRATSAPVRALLVPLVSSLPGAIALNSLLLVSLSLLMLGLYTRFAAVAVFCLFHVWIWHHQGRAILSGYDLLRDLLLLLIFTRSGATLSLDAVRAARRGKALSPLIMPWLKRLLELHLAFGYISAGLNKVVLPLWYEGRAFYSIVRHPDWYGPRIPEELLKNLYFTAPLTWSVPVIEIGLGLVLLLKPRKAILYPLLAAGIVFHGVMAAFLVFHFQWIMATYYLLFIDPKDIRAAIGRLKLSLPPLSRSPASR